MDYILDGLWTIGYALGYGHWQGICLQQCCVANLLVLTCGSSPFLCQSAAQVWLRADIMDAMPFVILPGRTYRTEEDFPDAVSFGGKPAKLLSFALSLRLNRNTRPTLKMFLRQFRLLHSSKRTARWFGLAVQEAYNLYRLIVVTLSSSCRLVSSRRGRSPTQSVRRKPACSSLCAPRAPSLATRA